MDTAYLLTLLVCCWAALVCVACAVLWLTPDDGWSGHHSSRHKPGSAAGPGPAQSGGAVSRWLATHANDTTAPSGPYPGVSWQALWKAHQWPESASPAGGAAPATSAPSPTDPHQTRPEVPVTQPQVPIEQYPTLTGYLAPAFPPLPALPALPPLPPLPDLPPLPVPAAPASGWHTQAQEAGQAQQGEEAATAPVLPALPALPSLPDLDQVQRADPTSPIVPGGSSEYTVLQWARVLSGLALLRLGAFRYQGQEEDEAAERVVARVWVPNTLADSLVAEMVHRGYQARRVDEPGREVCQVQAWIVSL